MLLERNGVDPNKPDLVGRTPLSWASSSGHEVIVRMLLERNGVDPNKLDSAGRTPLWWASSSGHEGIVRMLLEQNGVDPSDGHDHARAENLAHARALIELDHTKNL